MSSAPAVPREMSQRLREQMLANYRLFEKTAFPENSLKEAEESRRYALVKLLDAEFSRVVMKVRDSHKVGWRSLAGHNIVRPGGAETPLMKKLTEIFAEHRVMGIVINGQRFLPWVPIRTAILLPGGRRGGRHKDTPLVRRREFGRDVVAFVAHELEGKRIVDLCRATGRSEETVKQQLRRFRRLIDACRSAPPLRPGSGRTAHLLS